MIIILTLGMYFYRSKPIESKTEVLEPIGTPHKRNPEPSKLSSWEKRLPSTVIPVIKELMNSCGASSLSIVGDNSNMTCGNLIIHIYLPPNLEEEPDQPTLATMILTRGYEWVYDSETKIEGTTGGLNILQEHLEQQGLQEVLQKSSQVVAVGTASVEGEPLAQRRKAGKRAENIMIRIQKALPKGNQITRDGFYYLNLGKYTDQCHSTYTVESDTAYQRKVMVVSVLNSKNSTKQEIETKVKEHLSELPKELSSKCYSDFEFTL